MDRDRDEQVDDQELRKTVRDRRELDNEPDTSSAAHIAMPEGVGEPVDAVGRRIGQYKVKQVLASGGMGTVYLAMQEEPRRAVAVKLMKRGVTSRSALRRFRFEAQLLARLRHPGIAQIYEAGTFDDGAGGAPYFAMEYVPAARPLTAHACHKKLDVRERLELFAAVCDAVAHGHQKGIIHRDLKPSNILVDSAGRPKIIDFGVARATDSDMAVTTLQTELGQLVGTLQYMSPEQCGEDPLDIDTSSDVYALGVVLYELLCEELPYDLSSLGLPAAIETIRSRRPVRPGTVSRILRGDVETILFKALEKDRDRRYRNAAELGGDIQRYLNDEPITARPPGVIDGLRRFARRHTAVAVGMAVAFVGLTIGVVAVSVLLGIATGALSRAELANEALQRSNLALRQAQERSAGLAADLWSAEAAEVPAVWADDAALQKAAEASGRAESARTALEDGRPKDAAEQFLLAMTTLREAVGLHGEATEGLVRAGLDAAARGDPDGARRSLSKLEALNAAGPVTRELRAEVSLLQLTLVEIPPGEFRMGSPDDIGQTYEHPAHPVRIARPFLVSATEVTQGQFLAVTGREPSYFLGDLERPVEQVSWLDAIEFCNLLSARRGLSPRYELLVEQRLEDGTISAGTARRIEGTGYRLPTEAEWEYACRSGMTGSFSFGEQPDEAVLAEHMWYGANSGGTSQPVGLKPPNAWGLHDMHGNIWEWCEDAWHVSHEGAPGDGRAWLGGDYPSSRVLRGGAWISQAEKCRSAQRRRSGQGWGGINSGFRVARDAVKEGASP